MAAAKKDNVYVAITAIDHGEPDGTKVKFVRGEVVEGLDSDTMIHLYNAGAIVVQGSSSDDTGDDENVPPNSAPGANPRASVENEEARQFTADAPK